MQRFLKSSKGFTLIELLIVIAVLGILAVAVLSAINPIEQINRSKDTGSRSDTEQLISAIDRYYAAKGYYPWQSGATDTAAIVMAFTPVSSGWMDSAASVGVLSKLSEEGTEELKLSFINRITASGYNVMSAYHGSNPSDSLYVCFAPKSGAFATEAGDRCGSSLPGDYPDAETCNLEATGVCGAKGDCICLP